MPNTRYRHYKWHKRVSDFPFTHAIAASILISALVFMYSLGPSPFDEGLGSALVLFAVPATVLILIGLQWKGSAIVGYGIEQTGHWLAIGAWALNIWMLFTLGGTFTIATPAILAAAHCIRAWRLYGEARQIKHAMRDAAQAETVRQGGGLSD